MHGKSTCTKAKFHRAAYLYKSQSRHPSLPLAHSIQLKRNLQETTMAPSSNSKMLFFLQFLGLTLSILSTSLHASDPPLTLDYYASTCPSVIDIVKKEMACQVQSDPRAAPRVLRLHFHDCFVQVFSCFFFLHIYIYI